jgi:hypothetical protein
MNRTWVCGLVLLLLPVSLSAADELRALGGKSISGSLVDISDTSIRFQTDAGIEEVPLSQALTLDLRPVKGIPPGIQTTAVRLLDDTMLSCQSVTFKGNNVELTLPSGAQVATPISFLVWMVRDANNPITRKKFDDLLTQKSRRDRIVILRDTDLSALEGTLGDVDAMGTTIQFRRDGADAIGVLFERLHGLIFYRTDVPTATPLCRVVDTDGNSLAAVSLTLNSEGQCALTTSFGAKVILKRESLAKLDFNIGKLTYLSDLEPAKVMERSGIGLVTHYRKDTNLDGEPILLDKQYAKGLSLHAHTELTYNLAGKYKDFKAHLGVDARTGGDSRARVAIYCDGDKRFDEVVSVKRQKDIALSVKEVGTLRIVVSSRNFLDLHDHATLADARVSQ